MDIKKVVATGVGMVALQFASMTPTVRAEDAAPPAPKPAADNPPAPPAPPGQPGQPEKEGMRKRRHNGENNAPGGAGGAAGDRAAGGGGGGGPGGPPNFMQMLGGGGKNMMFDMASRIAGTTFEDPKTLAKVDTLPLGADRHFVLQVPVGGVDNLGGAGAGFKMEAIFGLTDEQTKAVTALRDEYDQKRKELETKIAAQQKTLAEEAIALRTSFEKRANDVLTGADKDSKQKVDTLASDAEKKNAAAASDTMTKLDDKNNDPRQLMTLARGVKEQTDKTVQETRKSMLDALPTESRAKAEELFKQQDAQKAQWNPDNFRRRGGNHGNDTPPAPPKENKDF